MGWTDVFFDFMQMLLNFFTMYGEQVTPGTGFDFNGNGIIDVMDWLEMLAEHQPDYSQFDDPGMVSKTR